MRVRHTRLACPSSSSPLADGNTGIAWFLTGFFIWNMDNIYCHNLKAARNFLLLPWAIVLEGHGWWHLFTGLGKHIIVVHNGTWLIPRLIRGQGAYYFIIWRVWLIRCLDAGEPNFHLRWPSTFTSVPQVVPRRAGEEHVYRDPKKSQ